MKISEMKVKSWYKVQLIAKTKTIKVTKQEFKTKAEGIEKGVSKGYDILNLKAVNKLLCEGWTEYTAKEENSAQSIVEPVKAIETKQEFNPEVEEQIRQNYIKAKERKGVEFVKGASIQEKSNVEAEYFAKMIQAEPIRKESEFQKTYDSKWGKYYEKREKEMAKEKASSEVTI